MLEASALELVLLFLVACIGIPSVALAVCAVAEAVAVAWRYRALRADFKREAQWERAWKRQHGYWPGGEH